MYVHVCFVSALILQVTKNNTHSRMKMSSLIWNDASAHLFFPWLCVTSLQPKKEHLEGIMNQQFSMWVAFPRHNSPSSFCHSWLPIKVCLNSIWSSFQREGPYWKSKSDMAKHFHAINVCSDYVFGHRQNDPNQDKEINFNWPHFNFQLATTQDYKLIYNSTMILSEDDYT